VSYATIDDLRSQLGSREPDKGSNVAYAAKMLHPLPEIKIVDRAEFLLSQVKGKRVLEFGATGPMHDAIVKVAASCFGVDRADGPGVVGFDLDDVRQMRLPAAECDVIICGEVLEHLSNPGHFLARLKKQYPGVPVVVTVPNAFSSIAAKWIAKGQENVNPDHVAWYSPKTLSVLLERAGYSAAELFFYNGNGPTAEGLIVVTE
jgi:2-polyprenyl-3-methyl-5-hydroxy-6-metoxy-1,4-benzoquinol methylase